MRKVICFFSIVLILVLSVVPAFAAEDDARAVDPNQVAADTSFPIDYVILNDGSRSGDIVTWPSVASVYQTKHYSYTYSGGYFDWSYRNQTISTYAVFADATNITLHTDFMVLYTDVASLKLSSSENNIRFKSISLGGNALISKCNDNGTQYVLKSESFGRTVTLDNVTSVDIMEILGIALSSAGLYDHYVAIQNLNITIDFYFEDMAANPSRELAFNSAAYNRAGLVPSWFGYMHIKPTYEVSDDFISWLLPILSNFLYFEIAPGLSINVMFNVILVVGLALWFIKIVS